MVQLHTGAYSFSENDRLQRTNPLAYALYSGPFEKTNDKWMELK